MEEIIDSAIGSIAPPPFEHGSVYESIREDILSGHLAANERLVVSTLAGRYGTSTNPVREALQQLRGEGFVIFSHNRGARVRPIDEEFVRDIYEMEVLIEPYLTRSFVGLVTDADLERLEAIQLEIETVNFADQKRHDTLDTAFHRTLYDRHYNRHAFEMWWRHREILGALSRGFQTSLSRRKAVLKEHRELIAALRLHDEELAAAVITAHVRGSGQHIIEQMRAARHRAHP